MRPPRFRRVPFVRDGVLDRGRASTPRITASHMLPSTGSEDLGLCDINISWLNSPPRTITVYASPAPSPIRTQHSLPGGPLRPYPCGTCPRWNSPASPGAPGPDFLWFLGLSGRTVAHLDGADDEYLAGPGGVEIALAVPKWDLRLIDLDDPLERFALGVNH